VLRFSAVALVILAFGGSSSPGCDGSGRRPRRSALTSRAFKPSFSARGTEGASASVAPRGPAIGRVQTPVVAVPTPDGSPSSCRTARTPLAKNVLARFSHARYRGCRTQGGSSRRRASCRSRRIFRPKEQRLHRSPSGSAFAPLLRSTGVTRVATYGVLGEHR
jgi:hypothetical protein